MIELSTNYKITLSQEQARQLFNLLQMEKSRDSLTINGQYSDLRELCDELKIIFNAGD